MPVLIILPTYNEHPNLRPLIAQIHLQLPEAHILIIDDGSPDGTGELADEMARDDHRIIVRHRPRKMGLGTAYLMGFRFALERDYDLIFQMDADFSHDPGHLPEFISRIEHADLVLGSRYIQGGATINWSGWRKLLSGGGGAYAQTILGVPYADLTSGFKCFRRRVLEGLPLDAIRSEGYSFQIETTYRAHLQGHRISEFPIIFRERRQGQSKISRGIVLEAIVLVWRLKLTL